MRKLLVCLVLAALVPAAVAPQVARAQDRNDVKIVAAASLGGVDRVMADVGLLSEMAGQEHLGKAAEGVLKLMTQGKGLAGLDRQRPWGILVGAVGEDVGGCAFVPVTDMEKLMDTATKMAKDKIKALDNGIYQIQGPHKTLYVQETHPGWAFVVEDPDVFQYVPADPKAELAGIDGQYDVAVRLLPANLPAELRRKIGAEMREHAEKEMARHKPKDEHGQVVREILGRKMLEDWLQLAEDLEEVTFGWRLDEDIAQGVLEVSMVTRQGTPSAQFLAPADRVRTAFGGFELPDAVLTARSTGAHPTLKAADLDALIDALKAEAYEKIDRKAKSDDEKEAGRKIVDGFLEVAKATGATGKIDAALALRLEEDAATYVGARHVADGPTLEATLKELVAAIRKRHPDQVGKLVTLDADQYRGVNMHVVSLPIPEDCPRHDETVAAVGDRLDVVLGFADEAVYVAAGRDAVKSLKRAIDASQTAGAFTVPPAEFALDVEEVAELATRCPKERVSRVAKRALETFNKADDRAQVRGAVLPIDRGLKFRLELDEGVLRLMANTRPKHHRKHE